MSEKIQPQHLLEDTVACWTCYKTRKKRRRTKPDEWEVQLADHHPAYITLADYEANQEKIAMNAQGVAPASRGAANRGSALLGGLIECRRCHHVMQVSYSSQGKVTYYCHRGQRQRERGEPGCIRFAGEEQILFQ